MNLLIVLVINLGALCHAFQIEVFGGTPFVKFLTDLRMRCCSYGFWNILFVDVCLLHSVVFSLGQPDS